MQALPDFIPQLNDPASNLAAFGAVVAPPLNPNPRRYYAYDGTFLGYGNDCDPISDERSLSGMIVPDILSENRLAAMQEWALPALVGTMTLAASGSPLKTTLWALGAYMAPLPMAALVSYQIVSRMPTLAGLGQHWPMKHGPVRTTSSGRRVRDVTFARPGPWRTQRYCARFRNGRCVQYKRRVHRAAYAGGRRRTQLLRG